MARGKSNSLKFQFNKRKNNFNRRNDRVDDVNEEEDNADQGEYRPAKKTGTLLTLQNCTTGPLKFISNEVFDQVVEAKGAKLIKPAVYQFYKGTEILNGNRYCVIEEGFKFPRMLQVNDKNRSFDIEVRYKGQEYLCNRCAKTHVGSCPSLTRYYQARDERRTTPIEKKIISDSTFRRADITGLKADVDCMSGGRIGHIANMIRDDPFFDNANSEAIITMGLNNILDEEEDFLMYKKRTELEVSKLKVNVAVRPIKKITIVNPILNKEEASSEVIKKCEDIKSMTKKMFEDDDRVKFVNMDDIEMDGSHPTAVGTKKIIEQINQHDEIILNNEYVVSEKRLYSDVTAHYIYGCLLCDEIWDLQYGYCTNCLTNLRKHIGIEEEGADKSGQKRERQDGETDENDENAKKSNNNVTPPKAAQENFNILQTYASQIIKPLTEGELNPT